MLTIDLSEKLWGRTTEGGRAGFDPTAESKKHFLMAKKNAGNPPSPPFAKGGRGGILNDSELSPDDLSLTQSRHNQIIVRVIYFNEGIGRIQNGYEIRYRTIIGRREPEVHVHISSGRDA